MPYFCELTVGIGIINSLWNSINTKLTLALFHPWKSCHDATLLSLATQEVVVVTSAAASNDKSWHHDNSQFSIIVKMGIVYFRLDSTKGKTIAVSLELDKCRGDIVTLLFRISRYARTETCPCRRTFEQHSFCDQIYSIVRNIMIKQYMLTNGFNNSLPAKL